MRNYTKNIFNGEWTYMNDSLIDDLLTWKFEYKQSKGILFEQKDTK